MAPTVEVLGVRDIERRRKALLERAGMSARRMRRKAATYALDQTRQSILRQLDELDFLAGGQTSAV